jgi:IPT/TIG domain
VLLSCLAVLTSPACSSSNSELGSRRRQAADPVVTPDDFVSQAGMAPTPTAPLDPIDPHALLGVNPAHGPFRGGGLAVLRGNGFSSSARVWFGDIEVSHEHVVATRADRVQVEVPAGVPGGVAVTTQNGDDIETRRVLPSGYHYDTFFAQPERGPTAGGSTLTLVGSGTAWTTETTVELDGVPCEVLALRGDTGGPQELDCRLPASGEGQKSIAISTAGVSESLLGGFTYEVGELLEGGLSGAPLAGDLNVYVTSSGGSPLPGAYVILGTTFDLDRLGQAGSHVRQTDALGSAPFPGEVTGPVTVTVAARCFQPFTLVAVGVDTLRAELTPVASPDCADAVPPLFGGSPARPVTLSGELVWGGALEQARAGWVNVPAPADPAELRSAYVFQPNADPENRFRLPRAETAITQASPGRAGYAFQLATGSGSRTLYALAGIENRTVDPPRFTAYALGMLRGIYADPGETIDGLSIAMDITLDQALTLELEEPTPSARGPDRLNVNVAVRTSDQGFLLLPNSSRQAPVPGSSSLSLVGLPALMRGLQGSEYAVSVRAVTGSAASLPQSVLPLITAREASQPIPVRSFVPVPTLSVGSTPSGSWNHSLAVSWTDRGRSVDLIQYAISSGSGLITWSVTAPSDVLSVDLPDLSRLPQGDLLPGGLDVLVALAGLPDFDYGKLEQRALRRAAWQAYSLDVASSHYER